jgi:hypothetical protein
MTSIQYELSMRGSHNYSINSATSRALTGGERAIVDRMIDEALTLKMEGETQQFMSGGHIVKLEHDLLFNMLRWFAGHYCERKPNILAAARVIQEHATWFVRNPTQYRYESAKAREKWDHYRYSLSNGGFWGSGDDGGCGPNSGNEDSDSTTQEEVVSYLLRL